MPHRRTKWPANPMTGPQDAYQAEVETHVAVQNMTELVRDDSLQLVTVQVVQRAATDADDRVVGCVARGKGVDAVLVSEQIHGRDRHSRRDGHLLHNVADLLFGKHAGRGIDPLTTEHRGHLRRPAVPRSSGTPPDDDRQCVEGDGSQQLRLEPVKASHAVMSGDQERGTATRPIDAHTSTTFANVSATS